MGQSRELCRSGKLLGWKIGQVQASALRAGFDDQPLVILQTPPSDSGNLHIVPLSTVEPATPGDVVDMFCDGMQALLADAFFLGASVLPLWSAFHEALDTTRWASPGPQPRRAFSGAENPATRDDAPRQPTGEDL